MLSKAVSSLEEARRSEVLLAHILAAVGPHTLGAVAEPRTLVAAPYRLHINASQSN